MAFVQLQLRDIGIVHGGDCRVSLYHSSSQEVILSFSFNVIRLGSTCRSHRSRSELHTCGAVPDELRDIGIVHRGKYRLHCTMAERRKFTLTDIIFLVSD